MGVDPFISPTLEANVPSLLGAESRSNPGVRSRSPPWRTLIGGTFTWRTDSDRAGGRREGEGRKVVGEVGGVGCKCWDRMGECYHCLFLILCILKGDMCIYMVGTHIEPWRLNYSAMFYHHVHITTDHISPFFPGQSRRSTSLDEFSTTIPNTYMGEERSGGGGEGSWYDLSAGTGWVNATTAYSLYGV